MDRKTIVLLFLCFGFIFSSSICAAELEDGLNAYRANDFLSASRIFKQFARQGELVAQRYLGEMYDKGRGVPQDYQKALDLYLRAASRNDAYSQYRLGLKYANGHGVKTDNKRAYAWFAMAFENGFGKAADPLLVLNRTMKTADKQLALKLAAEQMKILNIEK